MIKKVNKSDLGINYEKFDGEQRAFLEKMCDIVVNVCNKALDGAISTEDVDEKLKTVNESLKAFDAEKFAEVVKSNEELLETVKELTQNIEKMKQKGIGMDRFARFDESLETMFESEKFKSFLANTAHDARGFALKDVSMTNNYSGSVLITDQQQDHIVSRITDKQLHIRDLATVLQGDPNFTTLAWPMIEELNRNARYVSENGTLPESSFKLTEKETSVRRLGTHFVMSKRMLKCRAYVRSFILNKIVSAVLDAEDFGIIFGDGSGDMVKGITTYEGVLPVETIVNDTIIAGAAGSVKGVTKAANGIMVELTAPNDLLIEGLRITFTGATVNTDLNGVHDVIKLNDTQLLIEGAEYKGDETSVAAMTYKVNNAAFKSVEAPNSIDALETAIAVMTYAQFRPTVLMLNPITLNSIRTEKATDGNRLEVVKDINGNPVIGGLRVIAYPGIPAGKYFLGDFKEGAQIVEYTGLTIDWADDVNHKLKNQVVLMAQEELIVPVYCPWAFSYGSLSALKTAIAKD